MARPGTAVEALGQFVIKLHDRASGVAGRRILLVVDQRRLERHIRRKIHPYLRPTLGRGNDRCGEHSATVNALQSQPVKLLPTREAKPAATSKQFYAVIGGLDRLDPARGGDRRQPERLKEFPVDV